ncbi:MAG: TetR/AcrR family transcriptional regulator [Deltaproteobacteria bacterium]|nr:TetR/AcrR family transcriptional regulator [Deltaproteobacteria bacterium]
MDTASFPHALYHQIFDIKPGRGEARKVKIVEAFIDLVASDGIDHISFETLGKRVKMNRTHVAYYFANRDELIRTAVRYAVAVGQHITIGHTQAATGWREKLECVVEGPFHWMERHPKHASVMGLFYYLCSCDPSYRELQNSIRSMGEARILSCLKGSGLGHKRSVEVARQIQCLMAGVLNSFFSSDYPVPLAQLRRQTVKAAFDWVERG